MGEPKFSQNEPYNEYYGSKKYRESWVRMFGTGKKENEENEENEEEEEKAETEDEEKQQNPS